MNLQQLSQAQLSSQHFRVAHQPSIFPLPYSYWIQQPPPMFTAVQYITPYDLQNSTRFWGFNEQAMIQPQYLPANFMAQNQPQIQGDYQPRSQGIQKNEKMEKFSRIFQTSGNYHQQNINEIVSQKNQCIREKQTLINQPKTLFFVSKVKRYSCTGSNEETKADKDSDIFRNALTSSQQLKKHAQDELDYVPENDKVYLSNVDFIPPKTKKGTKQQLNSNATNFKLRHLIDHKLRPEIIYKNLLRDIRKYFQQEFSDLTPYQRNKRIITDDEPILLKYMKDFITHTFGLQLAQYMKIDIDQFAFFLGSLLYPKEMLKLNIGKQDVIFEIMRVYWFLYKFSLEKLSDNLSANPFLALVIWKYTERDSYSRISSFNFRTNKLAYIEACHIMISRSTSKKDLLKFTGTVSVAQLVQSEQHLELLDLQEQIETQEVQNFTSSTSNQIEKLCA